jgi:hypothetical protein
MYVDLGSLRDLGKTPRSITAEDRETHLVWLEEHTRALAGTHLVEVTMVGGRFQGTLEVVDPGALYQWMKQRTVPVENEQEEEDDNE